MSNDTVLDRSLIEAKLESLISRKQHEIIMTALKAGGKEQLKYARENLVQKFPKARTAKGKSKRTMVEEIHMINDDMLERVIVSVMNYLTKWYEMGTASRYLKENHPADDKHHRTYKKGEHRGQIKPLRYFREARETHEDDVIEAIENKVIQLLKKEFDNA